MRVLPNNQGTALLSKTFINNFQSGIIGVLFKLEQLDVVQNVAIYQQLVNVAMDANNPNQVNVFVPSQIIPQINGADISINVFSALYNFNK